MYKTIKIKDNGDHIVKTQHEGVYLVRNIKDLDVQVYRGLDVNDPEEKDFIQGGSSWETLA